MGKVATESSKEQSFQVIRMPIIKSFSSKKLFDKRFV